MKNLVHSSPLQSTPAHSSPLQPTPAKSIDNDSRSNPCPTILKFSSALKNPPVHYQQQLSRAGVYGKLTQLPCNLLIAGVRLPNVPVELNEKISSLRKGERAVEGSGP
jgi:hypothetical protein